MSLRIPEDKRDRLLSAGLKEFSEQGYENANTNKICEEAQISKGLLFHYFESKLGFYKWILEYVANYILESLDEFIAIETISLEVYSKRAIAFTLNMWNKKPEVIRFYQQVKFDKNPIVSDILTRPVYQKMLKIFNINVSSFTDIRQETDREVILFVLYKLLEIIFDTFFIYQRDISGLKFVNAETQELLIKQRINQIFDIFLNGAIKNTHPEK